MTRKRYAVKPANGDTPTEISVDLWRRMILLLQDNTYMIERQRVGFRDTEIPQLIASLQRAQRQIERHVKKRPA